MPAIDPVLLAKAMNAAPMTQLQLATEIKRPKSYICDVLHGRRDLSRSPQLRMEIARALGVPRTWIEVQPKMSDVA